MKLSQIIFFLGLLLFVASASGQSTDLASNQLLAIAEREASIYRKIAEDPDFYSDSDLDRRINELVQSYRSYLAEQPDDVSAYVLYGKLLRRLEEYDQAFIAFLKADELDPENAVIKQQIGNHLAEQGKGKAALTFYLNAISLEPETAIYHFGLGQLLHSFRSEFIKNEIFTRDALEREMLKAFRQAAALAPENLEFKMRLGEAYYDLSSPDWRSALVHWEKLRKGAVTGLQAEILDLHRARVLGKLGRLEEARALTDHIENPALQKSKEQVLTEIAQY
jgi:tetratricopeptide (TPR) repeat protein